MSYFIYFYAERHYAKCHYAECRYGECCYAECRYDPAEYFQPSLAFVDWAGVFIYSTIRRSKPDPQIDLGLYYVTFYGRNYFLSLVTLGF